MKSAGEKLPGRRSQPWPYQIISTTIEDELRVEGVDIGHSAADSVTLKES
jgi:hypothetical protein